MENTMTMREAFVAYWTKAFIFTGRARRREYWLSFLANSLLLLFCTACIKVITNIGHFGNGALLWFMTCFSIITVIPNASILARRFQDVSIHGKYAVWITLLFFIYDMIDAFSIPVALPEWCQIILLLLAFMTIITVFYICIKDSDRCTNIFGPNPKQNV